MQQNPSDARLSQVVEAFEQVRAAYDRAEIADLRRRAPDLLPLLRQLNVMLTGPAGPRLPGFALEEAAATTKDEQKRAPFAAKYDRPAREFVYEAIQHTPDRVTIPAIHGILASRGIDFTKATVQLAVKELVKDGRIERVPAEKGSGAQHAYRPKAQDHPLRGQGLAMAKD